MNLQRASIAFLVGIVAASSLSLPALAGGENSGHVESSAEVSNDQPVNVRLEVSDDSDPGMPGAQLAPDSKGDTRVKITGLAEDGNGWRDLKKATFRVLRPDGSTMQDDKKGEESNEGHGRERRFTFEFALTSGDPPGAYTVHMSVEDKHAAASTAQTTVEIMGYLAFSVEQTSVSFGDAALGPGATSHASPASIAIRNLGNVPLDLSLTGAPLENIEADASLGPDRIRYSASPDMANERALAASGTIDTTFDLMPGLVKSAYFDLHMPTGDEQYVPAGRYAGAITIGGVAG